MSGWKTIPTISVNDVRHLVAAYTCDTRTVHTLCGEELLENSRVIEHYAGAPDCQTCLQEWWACSA